MPGSRGLTRPKQLSMAANILSSLFFGSYRVNSLYNGRLCTISVALICPFTLLVSHSPIIMSDVKIHCPDDPSHVLGLDETRN